LPIDTRDGYLSHSAAMGTMDRCELWGAGVQLIVLWRETRAQQLRAVV
jgi:hypothetical protein